MPKPERPRFDFSVAPLPRPVYYALRDLQRAHQDASRWSVVVAAIIHLAREDPTKVEELLEKIRDSY